METQRTIDYKNSDTGQPTSNLTSMVSGDPSSNEFKIVRAVNVRNELTLKLLMYKKFLNFPLILSQIVNYLTDTLIYVII